MIDLKSKMCGVVGLSIVASGRADTLASIDRIEKIVKNTKARFVIQHDPADFKSLPKLPAYLN